MELPPSESEFELGRTRCRRASGCGVFALVATFVLLALVTFANPLLERVLADDPRALFKGLFIWVIIVAAWSAAGNGWFGLRGLRRSDQAEPARNRGRLGCGLALIPFMLFAAHYAINGPADPAPEAFGQLREAGLELASTAGSPTAGSYPNSTRWLQTLGRTNETWCVVEGLGASDPPRTPLLFSPNLRSDVQNLVEISGLVQNQLDASHPLGDRWVVVVRKNGSSATIDAHKTIWEKVVGEEAKGRILHP